MIPASSRSLLNTVNSPQIIDDEYMLVIDFSPSSARSSNALALQNRLCTILQPPGWPHVSLSHGRAPAWRTGYTAAAAAHCECCCPSRPSFLVWSADSNGPKLRHLHPLAYFTLSPHLLYLVVLHTVLSLVVPSFHCALSRHRSCRLSKHVLHLVSEHPHSMHVQSQARNLNQSGSDQRNFEIPRVQ